MSLPCLWGFLILGAGLASADILPTHYPEEFPIYNRDGSNAFSQPIPAMNAMRKIRGAAPMAPTQWQMMVSPFISLLPDVSDYCHCRGMANCGCCLGISLKPILYRNNVCLNASLTRDDYSGSKHMFRAQFHYDHYKIVDVSVSEREAPKICVTPPIIPVGGCAQITNIHYDRAQGKICKCLALSVEYHERSVFQLPAGCICTGRPVAEEDKRGLFGINILGLLSRLTHMLPVIG